MSDNVVKKWWVIHDDELFEAVVFKERSSYKKPIEFPIQGTRGFIIRRHKDVEIEFDEENQVFHGIGRPYDVLKYKKELERREAAHCH